MPLAAVIAEICALYGIEHIVRVIGFKGKAVAARCAKVVDGILQPAGFAHHRHRAVTQGYHLGKAAWFASAWHKQNIRTGINAARKRRHKSGYHAYPAGITRAEAAEKSLVLRFAAAQNHHLSVKAHNAVAHIFHKVNSLMGNKPPHHADKHGAWVNAKPYFLLEGGFVSRFSGKVFGIIVNGNVGVGFRIITFAVNTV